MKPQRNDVPMGRVAIENQLEWIYIGRINARVKNNKKRTWKCSF